MEQNKQFVVSGFRLQVDGCGSGGAGCGRDNSITLFTDIKK
jgi:hypothetical protein